ncbi:MAG TPA: ABC transporter substrate-binding protein [Roseiflexaceae bacterium]|nr:ABC transporter substrate-binding protein [Roseiflexaceae bacterium]
MMRWMGLLVCVLLLTACGTSGTGQPSGTGATAAPSGAATAPAAEARQIIMGMSYIPTVQFSHFYLADKKGYYAEEGLKVSFDYNFETDVLQRVAQGTVQIGLGSASSVLLARAQGLPIITVATNSQKFPTVFYSKVEQNIAAPTDLKGKTVGIPGRFGDAYIGLQALLYANKLQESDLDIQEIGFAQLAALREDKVQVASGYGNNEPVQLEQQGIKVNIIRVADVYPMASDGLVTSEALLREEPELVRGFVRATLRGMQDVINNPDEAFTVSLEYIPELQKAPAETQQLQRKVLQATLDYWQSDLTAKQGLGYTNSASWQATHTFLRDSGLLKSDVDLSTAFTNDYQK